MNDLVVIENRQLRVVISRPGAELQSIYSKEQARECLWQGDASIWGSRAPVLFPIVGALKDNTIYIDGKPCTMPQHGIVRNNDKVQIKERSDMVVTFSLQADDVAPDVYPYSFAFDITYALEANSLVVCHRVRNLGGTAMYFSLGGHPGFNCPFAQGDALTDYVLEFECAERLETKCLASGGLIGPQTQLIAANTQTLPLSPSMFDNGALIFTDLKSRKTTLRRADSQRGISVSYDGFPHLGIWAKPAAPYVCIEPWIGYADAWDSNQQIAVKPGMQRLDAQGVFDASFLITIE